MANTTKKTLKRKPLTPTCPPSCMQECVGGFCPYTSADDIPSGHLKYTIDGDPYCDYASDYTADGDRTCRGH